MVDSEGKVVVEEVPVDAQAESYTWKYLLMLFSLKKNAFPRCLSACSGTSHLHVFRLHVQSILFWGVQAWDRSQLESKAVSLLNLKKKTDVQI